MQPIAYAAAEMAEGPGVGVAEQHIAGRFVKAQLIKMVARLPFPFHIALPVDLDNDIVQQLLVGNGRVIHILWARISVLPLETSGSRPGA